MDSDRAFVNEQVLEEEDVQTAERDSQTVRQSDRQTDSYHDRHRVVHEDHVEKALRLS